MSLKAWSAQKGNTIVVHCHKVHKQQQCLALLSTEVPACMLGRTAISIDEFLASAVILGLITSLQAVPARRRAYERTRGRPVQRTALTPKPNL